MVTDPKPASIDLDKLEALARAATPQDFDSAQTKRVGGWAECPTCGGDGSVTLGNDYCNYDMAPQGVQFYGIGDEHKNAEAYYRAANPATVLALIALARRAPTTVPDHSAREAANAGALSRIPTEAMLNAARDWSVKKYGIGVGNDGATGCWQAMYDATSAAGQEAANAEDAARYRMMKENDFTAEYCTYIRDCLNERETKDLDEAIDAAMTAAPSSEKGGANHG
jgi:hypothetical protein